MSDDKGTSLRRQCTCPGCESHRRESEKLIEELRHKIYILESVIDMYVADREEIKSHISEEMIARYLPSVANMVKGEIERLRAALLCKRCGGTGVLRVSVADTDVHCSYCCAHEIRREAAG